MSEREPQAAEQIDLYERGGLTPAHWQEVLRRMRKPKDEISAKVVGYAQKVISGEFPDSGNHDIIERYLGRRHWKLVANLGRSDKVKEPRLFPPWPRITFKANELAVEVHWFARSSVLSSYTLNDYIYLDIGDRIKLDQFIPYVDPQKLTGHIRYDHPDMLVWNKRLETWQIFGNQYRSKNKGTSFERAGYGYLRDAEPDLMDKIWLITEKEIWDPVHLPPNILLISLLKRAEYTPQIIQARLRAQAPNETGLPYSNPSFGLLEQELS